MNYIEKSKINNITLLDLFKIIRNKILTILGWTVFGGILSIIITFFFLTPKYDATIDILVNQKNENKQDQYSTQQADLQAVNTYKDILQKPIVLENVVKDAQKKDNYDGNVSALKDSMSVKNEVNSKVISVTIRDKNSYVAADLANMIGNVFTKKIKKIMDINNVTIVSKARKSSTPVFPNKKISILLGILLGLVVGIIIVVIKELFDTTIKSVEQLNDMNLINLGSVFHIEDRPDDFKAVKVVTNDNDKVHRRV